MQKAREATGGMQKARRPHHTSGACLVRMRGWSASAESGVAARPPPSVAQPALCIPRFGFWFHGSTRVPWGVVTPSSAERRNLGPVFRSRPVGRGLQGSLWSRSARNSRLSMLVSDGATLRLHGQVLTGAQPLPLGLCGPHPICVCWVDCLVPVASWEPLVWNHSSVFKDPPSLQASPHRTTGLLSSVSATDSFRWFWGWGLTWRSVVVRT